MFRSVIVMGVVLVLAGPGVPAPVAAEPKKDERSENLYVVSFDKGALTLVDTAAHKEVKSIPLETNVNSVAVAADGAKAYLSFANGDHVLVVDLATGEKRAISGNIGWNSYAILAAPKDGMLYLATSGGTPPTSKVLCIDPSKDKVTDEIVIGRYDFPSGFGGFQLDPTAPRAFVLDGRTQELAVIDLEEKKVARRAPVPKGRVYAGLAIAPDGQTLYAGSMGGEEPGLFTLDPKTLEPHALGAIDGGTAQPVVSRDGKLVYAILNRTKIVGLQTADGKEVARWDVGDPVKALAISADGLTVYAACSEREQTHKVVAFDARSGKELYQVDVNSPWALLLAPAPAEKAP